MTPDELENAVVTGDTGRVISLVRLATEPERRSAGARAVALRKAHGDWPFALQDRSDLDRRRDEASLFALYGAGSAAQIRAGRRMRRDDRAFDLLRLRPTDLLVELTPWMLEHLGWPTVRRLVRDGVLPRPGDEAYIVGMLDSALDARALLQEDPALLDHEVWRLFEVEGTSDRSLADHDKYTGGTRTWTSALLDLAAGDPARRARLLDAILGALERDFPAFRAGWFSRFHEALAPTTDERAARVSTYLRLVRNPIPATTALAVAALGGLQRAGRLDPDVLLAHIGPALGARAAGTAKAALRLVDQAALGSSSRAAAAASVAAGALAHQSVDVQAAALSILERIAKSGTLVASQGVAERRADVAPSLQPRVDALLERIGGYPAVAAHVGGAEVAPLRVATVGGDAIASGGEHDAVASQADPFAALRPIHPVTALPELVEVIAHVLETEGPPEEIERVLDGIARLSADRPAGFARHVRSIRARAGRIQGRMGGRSRSHPGAWSDLDVGVNIATLVIAWVDGVEPEVKGDWEPSVGRFFVGRVAEVAHAAVARTGEPLLALPSYEGGWIEPAALVERLAARAGSGRAGAAAHGERRWSSERPSRTELVPYRLDLIQAMLRLLPARRADALAAARSLPGEAGLALRHALGDDLPIGPTRALWIAAARSRNPDGDDPAVDRAHPGLGADGALAGRFSVVVRGAGGGSSLPVLETEPPVRDLTIDLPTQLLATLPAQSFYAGGAQRPMVDLLRLVWPQSRRSWCAAAAVLLLANLDWWEARWANRVRLEPLFEPWLAVSGEVALLLAVALQAKEPGERGLAVEATAALLRSGRLTPAILVSAFRDLASVAEGQPAATYPVRTLRPLRVAASLGQIARVSPAHARSVLEVGAGVLDVLAGARGPVPVPIGQMTPLLRLLVELCAQSGRPIPDVARRTIEGLESGAGETARLSRRLLTGS